MRIIICVFIVMSIIFIASCDSIAEIEDTKSPPISNETTATISPSPEDALPSENIPSVTTSSDHTLDVTESPENSVSVEPPSEFAAFEALQQIAKSSGFHKLFIAFEPVEPGETMVSVDLNGDGKNEELVITVSDADDLEGSKPTRIRFSINESEYVFEDSWNDGIVIEIVDFDKKDAYQDICIYISGTDIEGGCCIIRYDGEEFSKLVDFPVTLMSAYHDGDGHIYYMSYDSYEKDGYIEFNGYAVFVLDIATNVSSPYIG